MGFAAPGLMQGWDSCRDGGARAGLAGLTRQEAGLTQKEAGPAARAGQVWGPASVAGLGLTQFCALGL